MRTFKALPFLLCIALLTPFISSTGASAEAPSAFSFTGSGYGHGVGMSQIGAKARALTGESATAILRRFG
jgi:SpoIID/LytB domain protein